MYPASSTCYGLLHVTRISVRSMFTGTSTNKLIWHYATALRALRTKYVIHLYEVKFSASVSKHHEVQIFCYSQLLYRQQTVLNVRYIIVY
jgi:hypothetical protein